MSDENPAKKKLRLQPKMLIALLGLLLIALSGGYAYLYHQYSQLLTKQSAEQNQQQQIMAELGKVIILPAETPTIATVVDNKKLTDPQLSAQAKNNDSLVIFPQSKRVILYRQSERKVVDMFHIEQTASAAGIGN